MPDPVNHIAIVGTGSAAFAAAIKSIELGSRVTLIESAENIGGTCVNTGCVPSKIFIRGAHLAHIQAKHKFAGIAHNKPAIDRTAMLRQQTGMVKKLRFAKYENILDTYSDIELVRGRAHFKNPDTLIVTDSLDGKKKEIAPDRILLAVGARPTIPDITGLSDTPFWTSTEALNTSEIPEHLLILGGSVVALELAQAFFRLGAKVTLLARSTLLSKGDEDISAGLTQILTDDGLDIRLHTVAENITYTDTTFTILTRSTRSGTETIHCDRLLVATGRQSNSDTLALENAGIQVSKSNAIIVDDHMCTNINNIYAAGDCTDLPQYVYVAAAAGTRAALNMHGRDASMNLSVVPVVIFTDPQIACAGLTQAQAKAQSLQTVSRTLNLEHVPRAIANMDTRGFIKLVAMKTSGRIVGCQVLGDSAGEIIQSAALAISNRMTTKELSAQLFPYLTMVEALKLVAQTFDKDVSRLSCCAG